MRTISTLDDFHALVKSESPKLVVVDFFAEWCGPCKRVAPQYAQLAEIHSKTACFVKVDVDASPELSSFGRISAMPTFQVYKGGERVAEVKGARMDELERSIALWGADVERQLAAAAAAAATHVPLQQLLRFEDGKVEKIVPKLLQFNDELRAEGHAHALDDAGADALKQLGAALERARRRATRTCSSRRSSAGRARSSSPRSTSSASPRSSPPPPSTSPPRSPRPTASATSRLARARRRRGRGEPHARAPILRASLAASRSSRPAPPSRTAARRSSAPALEAAAAAGGARAAGRARGSRSRRSRSTWRWRSAAGAPTRRRRRRA